MQHHSSVRESAQSFPAFSIFIMAMVWTFHDDSSPAKPSSSPEGALGHWGCCSQEEDTGERDGGWWVEVTSSAHGAGWDHVPRWNEASFSPSRYNSRCAPHRNDSGSQCWPAFMVSIRLIYCLQEPQVAPCYFHKGWEASNGTRGDWTRPLLCPGRVTHEGHGLSSALLKMFVQEQP